MIQSVIIPVYPDRIINMFQVFNFKSFTLVRSIVKSNISMETKIIADPVKQTNLWPRHKTPVFFFRDKNVVIGVLLAVLCTKTNTGIRLYLVTTFKIVMRIQINWQSINLVNKIGV